MKKLVVFDLDFTLWDAGGTWCDCTNPPYKKVNNHVVDASGSKIKLYPDVLDILNKLKDQKIEMALASRTSAPSWARQLLNLLEIEHFFELQEIYPGSKILHFSRLQKARGFKYSDMIFFDDEMRNISEVGSLGVHAVYVENGINNHLVNEALNHKQ
ncbi:magnesium-dependent phosphatase-1 [Plebeiibacterium sediminum]|uniref:Magnesium-dependent phosphatase-1 n=1 Tax=Plebeiibacterium sediminum TaxID=2992112 RepID=A0AAE3M6I9_9BACT|nr:magnesium-dependent phosphatase-1 [Plebeiobacterium sediminum]MCW3787760.1 magnesium-dependent phosphatase-1 [Plebeiobacterium sediminum]